MKKTTHTEIGKKEGIHCRGSARGFCSVYPILNSSYLYYIIEVWFLAALQIICISALWYKRLPHWLGSFYIFSALMFLWHTYLCKIQGFGGPSPCSSRFIATRKVKTALTQNVGMGSLGGAFSILLPGIWRLLKARLDSGRTSQSTLQATCQTRSL